MGPSVFFPLPRGIAQKLPVRNSLELFIKKLPIPLPIFYYLELNREVLAETEYPLFRKHCQAKTTISGRLLPQCKKLCGLQCAYEPHEIPRAPTWRDVCSEPNRINQSHATGEELPSVRYQAALAFDNEPFVS